MTPEKNDEFEEYRVKLSLIGETVLVYAARGVFDSNDIWECVDPPNWLDRLLGRTHTDKISNAVIRVRKKIDTVNLRRKRSYDEYKKWVSEHQEVEE